ncbi:MAG: ribosome maturation factor RimM [Butyrivibrio sp.]|nr:ribosome maturation factor RimM [Butyrivibrio sp.]
MDDLLRVGVITSTHGIAGAVKVYPTTDDVKRFKKLKRCILVNNKEHLELDIVEVKYFKNMVILRFKQFDNINQIEKYKNSELYVTRENAVALEEGEYFICDLIGLEVVDENNNKIGTISDVLQTSANDVYEIDNGNGKKYLFPAIKQVIKKVNLEEGIMTVHVLKGLLDL